MSELSRWKEFRIRQEIYLESLKESSLAPNQVDSGGTNTEVSQTSLELLRRDKPGRRAGRQVSTRTKNHRLSGALLRSGVLAGGVAICLWLWWVEFGIHR
jgi:uncharacterized membrane protein YccC